MGTEMETEQEKVIDDLIEALRTDYKNEFSGHDFWHLIRVYKTATELAVQEGADLFTVQLAALLHDVDDVKLSPETHEELSNAVSRLKEYHVEDAVITKVCDVIRQVSFKGKDTVKPSTMEAMCVQDADRLDAMGAIGIARTFAFGGNHNIPIYDPEIVPMEEMSKEDYINRPTTSVNHFYEKLLRLSAYMNTKTAKRMAAHREAFMREYLREFFSEWQQTEPETLTLKQSEKSEKIIIRVVLTGGPGSGKSDCSDWLSENFRYKGFKVMRLSETATELITSGISPQSVGNLNYQMYQMKTQLQKEATMTEAVQDLEGDRFLVICDRGTVDNKAYMNEKEYQKICASLGISKKELGVDRYDAVLFLETAARGDYTTENNRARISTWEQARERAMETREVWKDHPCFYNIERAASMEEKRMHISEVLQSVIDSFMIKRGL